MAFLIPTVIEKRRTGDVAYDIFSRLLEDRIVFIGSEINLEMANSVIAQLLFLEKESATEEIKMYINSYGGVITAGMSIIDTMNHIKPDVSTIVVGVAASMGAMLLACGKKGKRFALPNAEILIHQPSGGIEGQATEIDIAAKHILKWRENLYGILSRQTGKPMARIEKDADRDNWMDAKQALSYGLIDKILK
jgi:ATP-dependent Clp protease protease subunit